MIIYIYIRSSLTGATMPPPTRPEPPWARQVRGNLRIVGL